jgi:hypothetical protein
MYDEQNKPKGIRNIVGYGATVVFQLMVAEEQLKDFFLMGTPENG